MMMDRHTYRGKRIDTGEWVFGSLFIAKWIDENGDELKEYFIQICPQRYSRPELETEAYKVDPATIGQCTGLMDKHGKAIFEGDVATVEINAKVNRRITEGFMGPVEEYDTERQKAEWTVEHRDFNASLGYRVYGKDRRFNAPLSNSILGNTQAEITGTIHDITPDNGGEG